MGEFFVIPAIRLNIRKPLFTDISRTAPVARGARSPFALKEPRTKLLPKEADEPTNRKNRFLREYPYAALF